MTTKRTFRLFIFLFVTAIPAVLTLFLWQQTQKYIYEKNRTLFENIAQENERALEHRIESYAQALLGGVGFFSGSDNIERGEWAAYVSHLDLAKNFPGISGIGYIASVDKENAGMFLEQARRDEAPDFKIHPEGSDHLFVITYIEPANLNKEAVGLNIAFEKNRYEAAILSRDNGAAAITKRIFLVQDEEKTPGFLLLMPMYKKDMSLDTVEQRRDAFEGWIYAPFVAKNLMHNLTEFQNSFIDFEVFDGTETTNDTMIYDTDYSWIDDDAHRPLYHVKKTIDLYQQKWTLVWKSTQAFENSVASKEPFTILVSGSVLTVLLGIFVAAMLSWTAFVEKIVEQRTAELHDANTELEEFAYRTSHDLRAPIASSIGLLDLAQDSMTHQDTKMAFESILRAKGTMKKLDVLIQDILSLTEARNKDEERKEINFKSMLETAIDKIRYMDGFADVSIENDLRFEGRLIAHESRLRTVVENLLSNAVKYRDPKKKVNIIKVSTYEEGQQFVLRIEDNGLGIPKEQQENVFGMFKRFHPKVSFGTGLGLYLVKKSVDVLGGTIFYEDTGDGSAFIFKVPKE